MLFTNIPLDKTIKIFLRKIYQERKLDRSIPQKRMERLLYLCTKHALFGYGRISCFGKYIYDKSRNCNHIFVRKLLTKLEMIGRQYICVCSTDKIGYIVNQLIFFNKSIEFTFEMEKENKLAFLGVMVTRSTNDTISTKVYREPKKTDSCINWDSYSPLQ